MNFDTDRSVGLDLALEGEAVLPAQLLGRQTPDSPERQLMAAVLADAVSQYRQYALVRGARAGGMFAEAARWIGSDDVSWPYSFRNICDVLGIDGDALRDELRRWRAARETRMVEALGVVRLRSRTPSGSRHAVASRALGLQHSA